MACIIFGILFAVFMPLIGIFFCCLRCCGRCGGRIGQMDRKADPCRRVCYTVTLAIITTIQLAAIVLAFINYQLHYEAIFNKDSYVGMIPQLEKSTQDISVAITQIVESAKDSSSVDLEAQKMKFDTVFDAGLASFQDDFVRTSSAAELLREKEKLQRVAYQFSPNSHVVTELTDFLDSIDKLNNELPFIASTISDILNTDCSVNQLSACVDLRATTDKDLKVKYTMQDFQEAQVQKLLKALGASQQSIKDLDKFSTTLLQMKDNVKKELAPILNDAWKDLSNSQATRAELVRSIEGASNKVKNAFDEIHESIAVNFAHNSVVYQLRDYVLYTGIALLLFPVLIILLVYLGLCFGACGDRPYEEASLCNRGVGANFLMSAVVFTFLFPTLLMLICMVAFNAGGLIQTEICRYATSRYPNGPSVLDDVLLDMATFTERSLKPATTTTGRQRPLEELHNNPYIMSVAKARPFSAILTKCANQSLVESVGDETIGLMVTDASINTFLENLLKTFNGMDLISPLRQTATEAQRDLAAVNFLNTVNFDAAIKKCSEPLTGVADLNRYISQLQNLKIQKLDSQIAALQETVVELTNGLGGIKQIYEDLQSLGTIYNGLTTALDKFSVELDQTVPTLIRSQIDNLRPLFRHELRLAVIASWRDIPCQNLHEAAKTGVNAVCVTLIGPLNGFWVGLGVCLVLFIPGLLFAVKLVNLYRKTEKYSPDYEEPFTMRAWERNTDYISYHGFYMRPASGDADGQNQRKHARGKTSQSRGKTDTSGAYGFSHRHGPGNSSAYQPVSVYPYDAYE